MLLLVMVTSCREESDAVQNYAFNDGLAFEEAMESYAGKFKVMWKALDQNYGIWDYERSLGLDWDAVYDEFLPKYEALDKRDDVTDDELRKLLEETLAPLHDGHFGAQMENHQTGGSVLVDPSSTRDQQRDDYEAMENTTHYLRIITQAWAVSGQKTTSTILRWRTTRSMHYRLSSTTSIIYTPSCSTVLMWL